MLNSYKYNYKKFSNLCSILEFTKCLRVYYLT